MKKLLVLCLALCMAFTLAAPALAEGVLTEAPLGAADAAADAPLGEVAQAVMEGSGDEGGEIQPVDYPAYEEDGFDAIQAFLDENTTSSTADEFRQKYPGVPLEDKDGMFLMTLYLGNKSYGSAKFTTLQDALRAIELGWYGRALTGASELGQYKPGWGMFASALYDNKLYDPSKWVVEVKIYRRDATLYTVDGDVNVTHPVLLNLGKNNNHSPVTYQFNGAITVKDGGLLNFNEGALGNTGSHAIDVKLAKPITVEQGGQLILAQRYAGSTAKNTYTITGDQPLLVVETGGEAAVKGPALVSESETEPALQVAGKVTLTSHNNNATVTAPQAAAVAEGGALELTTGYEEKYDDMPVSVIGGVTSQGTIINGRPIDDGVHTEPSVITVQGSLDNKGQLNNLVDGILNVPENSTLENSGALTNEGTLDNAGTVTNASTLENTGTVTNTGTLDNTSTGKLDNAGTLDNQGTLDNDGEVVNQIGAQLSGNKITGSGTVTTLLPPTQDTAIALDKATLELKPGDTAKLKASLTPADATYKYIFWTSSDETVATVSDSGLVTAIADGTATITAKSWYGNTATCAVTVKTTDEPTPPEPSDPWPTEGLEGFVTRCYRVALSRDPDKAGHGDWVRWLKDGTVDATSCTYGFVFSKEMNNKKLSDEDFVKTLYNLFMDREGEAAGVTFWTEYLQAGHSRLEVFYGFADSVEFGRIKTNYGIQ